MKKAQDIILAPVITEKSMYGVAEKKYTFKVANDSQVSWIRSNALSKLQLRLNELLRWSALKLDVGKVESQGTLREAYTPDEKLAVMANSNPELRKLMKDVDGILK